MARKPARSWRCSTRCWTRAAARSTWQGMTQRCGRGGGQRCGTCCESQEEVAQGRVTAEATAFRCESCGMERLTGERCP
eukprot:365860-Chlamydomonas_euryale.AAC.10